MGKEVGFRCQYKWAKVRQAVCKNFETDKCNYECYGCKNFVKKEK